MRPGSGGGDPALLLGALGYAAWRAGTTSYALSAAITLLASLLLLRAFVLMHGCGHGSLFRSGRLNRGSGFALAVLNGMPLGVRIAAFEAPCRSSVQELRQMSWNNVAVLQLWGLAARLMGPWPFVGFYIVAASLAGAAGLVLF